MKRRVIVAIGVALLLVTAGCSAGSSSQPAQQTTPAPDKSTIQVAGSGSADAAPNQAIVQVSVVATAADAATARQRLASNTSRMRTALERIGINDSQIRTQRYDIYRDERRPREEGGEPRIQYRASHDFRITVSDPDRVGTVIDTSVQNGATEVNDVMFTLSSERRKELERRARSAAMQDAKSKAQSLATHANLTVSGVDVIQTTNGDGPRPYDEALRATATAAPSGPPTDLESGPVTVRVTVHVVYKAVPAGNATA